MDVKRRNDELAALRQQVEALTASRNRLRDYARACQAHDPYADDDNQVLVEQIAMHEAWQALRWDDMVDDPAPSLPVLDPMACAERDTTPLEWDGERK